MDTLSPNKSTSLGRSDTSATAETIDDDETSASSSGYYCLLDHHGAGTTASAFDEDTDSETTTEDSTAHDEDGMTADSQEGTDATSDADLTLLADQLLRSMEGDYARVCAATVETVKTESSQTSEERAEADQARDDDSEDDEAAQTPINDSSQPQSSPTCNSVLAEPMSAAKVARIKQLMSSFGKTAKNKLDASAINVPVPEWARDLQWQDGQLDQVMSHLVTANVESQSRKRNSKSKSNSNSTASKNP